MLPTTEVSMYEEAEELTFTISLSRFNCGLHGKTFFKVILSPFAELLFMN